MSRNDFEILARHLKAMYPTVSSSEAIRGETGTDENYRDGYNAAINQVIGACSAVNARFNKGMFKRACGVA